VAGPAVVVAHRYPRSEGGPTTYVLFTDAAAERVGIAQSAKGMRRYTGRYAHFDDVDYYVIALDRAGRGGEAQTLLGLGSLLGDLALGADPRPHDDLRPVVAA